MIVLDQPPQLVLHERPAITRPIASVARHFPVEWARWTRLATVAEHGKHGVQFDDRTRVRQLLSRPEGEHATTIPFGILAARGTAIKIAAVNSGTGYQSHSVPLPAGVSAGDLLLVIGNVSTGSGARTISTPLGYTSLYNAVGPGNLRRYYCFYKTADGTETTVPLNPSSTNTYCSTVTLRITGWAAIGTFAALTGSSGTADPPSQSPAWGSGTGTLAIAVAHDDIGALGTPTFPADYPVQHMQYFDVSGSAWGRCTVGAKIGQAASFDPTGITMTGSGSWAATTICVRSA